MIKFFLILVVILCGTFHQKKESTVTIYAQDLTARVPYPTSKEMLIKYPDFYIRFNSNLYANAFIRQFKNLIQRNDTANCKKFLDRRIYVKVVDATGEVYEGEIQAGGNCIIIGDHFYKTDSEFWDFFKQYLPGIDSKKYLPFN